MHVTTENNAMHMIFDAVSYTLSLLSLVQWHYCSTELMAPMAQEFVYNVFPISQRNVTRKRIDERAALL